MCIYGYNFPYTYIPHTLSRNVQLFYTLNSCSYTETHTKRQETRHGCLPGCLPG
jgi:hypothetical protein